MSTGSEQCAFDGLVPLYEQTRIVDGDSLNRALDYLTSRFPPERFADIFEPGIGTGRMAFPLARCRYKVTGVDVSVEMLAKLQSRLSEEPLEITHLEADATELPYQDGSFNLSVAVHIFDFIRNWKKAADEVMRVTDDNGAVIAINTGRGTQIPFLSTRYKELCAEKGSPIVKVGARASQEVIDYFKAKGHRAESIRGRWGWISNLRPDEALAYIDQRAYSFTAAAPDAVHAGVMQRLRLDATTEFGNLTDSIKVPNEIGLDVIWKR